jgi:hypothetical protein
MNNSQRGKGRYSILTLPKQGGDSYACNGHTAVGHPTEQSSATSGGSTYMYMLAQQHCNPFPIIFVHLEEVSKSMVRSIGPVCSDKSTDRSMVRSIGSVHRSEPLVRVLVRTDEGHIKISACHASKEGVALTKTPASPPPPPFKIIFLCH